MLMINQTLPGDLKAMKHKILLVCVICCLALSGCDTTDTRSETESSAAVEDRGSSGESGSGSSAQTFGVESGSTSGMNALEDPAHPMYNLLSERVIYFGYDQSTIQDQYRAVLEAHGAYIADNPNVIVTLEGHADERGSREYNLALGERRAISVESLMTLLGASAAQIRTVSYGEERPVAQGHDEAAYSLNRRVEIIY